MSNLERDPVELLCPPDVPDGPVVQILAPRDVPLGGPRAMNVRRTLPQRGRTTIGAWCFADHYGPDEVHAGRNAGGGMVVPPHPHTGLQTVSWLFEGEIEHRDSAGSHELVRPGAVNLMTAGRGISHSEVSTPGSTRLHGLQLWVALPDASRHVGPFFEHADTTAVTVGDATVRVFVGALAGGVAPESSVTVFSPAPRGAARPARAAARSSSSSTRPSNTACSSTRAPFRSRSTAPTRMPRPASRGRSSRTSSPVDALS